MVSLLKGNVHEIGTAANDVAGRIDLSRQKLTKESEQLQTVSVKAIEAANKAADIYGKQSAALFKASNDALENARKVQDKDARSQKEAFLSSAKFIVESLHSLSVDLTRTMEGEISERVWKAYQKGDLSIFTRRLAEIGVDNVPVAKLQDKLTKDTEFRTYVQRFIRQFEELFDQAQSSDHGSLLTSVFLSSEMGKLYGILCKIMSKVPRNGTEFLKAA